MLIGGNILKVWLILEPMKTLSVGISSGQSPGDALWLRLLVSALGYDAEDGENFPFTWPVGGWAGASSLQSALASNISIAFHGTYMTYARCGEKAEVQKRNLSCLRPHSL